MKESLYSSDSELGLWPKEDSCAGTIKTLLHKGIKADDIVRSLIKQNVEIVLTAHPTEVNRKTMLRKHDKIKDLLDKDDNSNVSLYEKKCNKRELSAEITSIWYNSLFTTTIYNLNNYLFYNYCSNYVILI